ncbi:SRPBCC family protein [Psychroflexus aestuariivivens]|uniref:SRPBCC family protein n=1 Tax=Psychroflexus aestuariivivens TaxID=1795040 RepID=UPI000FDACDEA|nr:SRPBCC family protein [Psychroflexus aestuariivivens]
MKYKVEINIGLPRQRVVELFDSVENMYKWMKGLQEVKLIEGEPGQVGAKSELHFNMGKRDMIMVETITNKDLPDQISGTYQMGTTLNIQHTYFVKISENSTKMISENEFQMKGAFKFLGWIMPGLFRKQTEKYLTDFKNFAESKA